MEDIWVRDVRIKFGGVRSTKKKRIRENVYYSHIVCIDFVIFATSSSYVRTWWNFARTLCIWVYWLIKISDFYFFSSFLKFIIHREQVSPCLEMNIHIRLDLITHKHKSVYIKPNSKGLSLVFVVLAWLIEDE